MLHGAHLCPLARLAIPAREAHLQAVSSCIRDNPTTADIQQVHFCAEPPLGQITRYQSVCERYRPTVLPHPL
jgi:hypothetical protein